MKNKLKRKKILSGAAIFVFIFLLIFLFSGWSNLRVLSQPYDQLAPRAPQNFSIKVGVKSAHFNWKENYEPDVFSYLLYVREEGKSEKEPIFIGKADNYLLENLNPEKTYQISLAAQDTSKNIGPKSNEISFSPDSSHLKNFKVAGWMQATADLDDAQRTFMDNTDVFTDLSPFWYSAQADGTLEKRGQIINEEVASSAKNKQINIIPTITNNFDEDGKLSELLKDEEKTRQHLENIVNEVLINDYEGIDIDYENLGIEIKDNFTYFIENLAEKLHEKGKLLSVTVQAKKSDANIWDGVGALNFKKLGQVADQFRIMTYDYSRLNTDPGPIAPLYWFKEVLEYAKSKVPEEKIIAGIPTYAYQWCTSEVDSCESKGLTWDGVQNIISRYDPVLEWNDMAKSPWFIYVDDNNNTKAVYYENYQSIDEKLKAVKELNIGGIAIWRLGSEDPQNYEVIRENLGKKMGRPTGIKAQALDEAIYITWDKADNDAIKGYRLTIKEKEGLDLEDDNESLENLSAQELLEKIKSGEYSYADSTDEWQEEYIDIYDQSEYTFENLHNGKTYYFSLMALSGNEGLSEAEMSKEELALRTSSEISVVPSDQYFPGTINNIEVLEIDATSATLSWINAGDDYLSGAADQFDIRYSENEINENNFSEAKRFENTPKPLESLQEQTWQAGGLDPGKKYTIAARAIDEAGNYSELSNIVAVETIDNIAPVIPAQIEAVPLDGEIFVKWEKGSEEDIAGYKIFYKKESGYYEVAEVSSDKINHSLKGLENGFNYYVSLSVYDLKGNESIRSDDLKVSLSGNKNVAHYQNSADKYYEKLKASLVLFSKRLFNDRAVPFIVVLSVLVVNFFIYQGIKREINRKSKRKSDEKEDLGTVKSNRVVDLKNFKKIIK